MIGCKDRLPRKRRRRFLKERSSLDECDDVCSNSTTGSSFPMKQKRQAQHTLPGSTRTVAAYAARELYRSRFGLLLWMLIMVSHMIVPGESWTHSAARRQTRRTHFSFFSCPWSNELTPSGVVHHCRTTAMASLSSITSPRTHHHLHYHSKPRSILRISLSAVEDGSLPDRSSRALTKLQDSKLRLLRLLRQNDYPGGFAVLEEMMQLLEKHAKRLGKNNNTLHQEQEWNHLSECFDQAVQSFVRAAFQTTLNDNARTGDVDIRLQLAAEAIQLQLNCTIALAPPFHQVPLQTLLEALRALTDNHPMQQQQQQQNHKHPSTTHTHLDAAFNIWQRLVTGVGVRQPVRSNNNNLARVLVGEKDLNRLLHACSNAGRMDMADRIVAIQQRTPHAPSLSAVSYSILLHGHGRLRDLVQVNRVWQMAQQQQEKDLVPDTILCNSLMDAYINCHALDQAQAVFKQMQQQSNQDGASQTTKTTTKSTSKKVTSTVVGFPNHACPPPNRRTYNIMLKGLAQAGRIDQALQLAHEMKQRRLWDSITTNTVVHAAVVAKDLDTAQSILAQHTFREKIGKERRQHPNVQAYTELLDGYAKNGQLEQAFEIFKLMQQQSVQPNEITYACLVAGLARQYKMEQVQKLLAYMTSTGIEPTAVTFNALISAVLGSSSSSDLEPQQQQQRQQQLQQQPEARTNAAVSTEVPPLPDSNEFNIRIDHAMTILRDMIESGVRPNVVTVSVLVQALGQCSPPRIQVATRLVDKLERQGMIPAGHPQVVTAAVHACGLAGDIRTAIEVFSKLKKPDVVAINAFLDVCVKCERESLARGTFDHYFRNQQQTNSGGGVTPDVISYSVIISSLLKTTKSESIVRARRYYEEMKTVDQIQPDNVLVDIVLRGMLRLGRSRNLSKKDAYFVATVLRDAEKLEWEEGQLLRRKRAVRAVLSDELRAYWKNDYLLSRLLPAFEEDDLFERKGWNRVDSGFSLWPSAKRGDSKSSLSSSSEGESVDKFLSSHGWNDVDSGFRIL